jgi:hypothetical protein
VIGPWRRAVLAEAARVTAESRATALEGQLVEAHGTIRSLSDMLREYTTQLVSMKREGFMPPAPTYHGAPEPELPDEVLEAMYEQAKPGDAVWSQLAVTVGGLMGKLEPSEIAQRVRQGEDLDWGD